MRFYLNWKGPQGRETVDEVLRSEFDSNKAFRKEVSRLCTEYALAGMAVYTSSRPCKGWEAA